MWFEQNYVSQPNVVWAELRVSVQRGVDMPARAAYIAASGSSQQLDSPAV